MIFDSFNEFSKELWVNVLAYDYEGYGKAGGELWSEYPIQSTKFSFSLLGESSEANCYDDIDAAYNFLTEKMQMKPENIVLYGRSLGSGPSCYLAERLQQKENIQIGGLILQVLLTNNTRCKYLPTYIHTFTYIIRFIHSNIIHADINLNMLHAYIYFRWYHNLCKDMIYTTVHTVHTI